MLSRSKEAGTGVNQNTIFGNANLQRLEYAPAQRTRFCERTQNRRT